MIIKSLMNQITVIKHACMTRKKISTTLKLQNSKRIKLAIHIPMQMIRYD